MEKLKKVTRRVTLEKSDSCRYWVEKFGNAEYSRHFVNVRDAEGLEIRAAAQFL